MVRSQFSKSQSYLQSILGLHRLHQLTVAGNDDSPEADAIRDSLDRPWYELSETEKRRIEGLSADLYSITDPSKDLLPSNPQVQRKLHEASEAYHLGKWDLALEILRRWGSHVDPALLSFLRGTIWEKAGDNATAVLFFEHAAGLAPDLFKATYLYHLQDADPDAALKLGREVLDAELSNTPNVVVTAAGLFFDCTRHQSGMETQTLLEQLIQTLERTVKRIWHNDSGLLGENDDLKIRAALLLAGCYGRLGNTSEAIRQINSAVSLDPSDASTLTIRGILRYGRDAGARDDFFQAIQLGSPSGLPAFYLAHDALVAGRFEDCLNRCREGLAFSAIPEVLAMLHEWHAISRAELRYPEDQIRSEFEEALRLAPDSDRIRQNFNSFEATVGNPNAPRPRWDKPKASIVQSLGLGRSAIRSRPPSQLDSQRDAA